MSAITSLFEPTRFKPIYQQKTILSIGASGHDEQSSCFCVIETRPRPSKNVSYFFSTTTFCYEPYLAFKQSEQIELLYNVPSFLVGCIVW